MAFASDSTTAPFGHPRLLQAMPVPTPSLTAETVDMLDAIGPERPVQARGARGRFVKIAPELPTPPLLSSDTPDAIRADLDALVAKSAIAADLPVEPDTALAARTRHLRRQLVQAAEHGAALLAALGLPRLVTGDFIQVDPVAAGDALDAAIAALDALDGDADFEPEEGYDLPEGDDERCGSEHDGCEPEENEDSLGSPAGDGDQRHWAQGAQGEREADPCDGPGLVRTVQQEQAARDRRPEMHALTRRAFALRRPAPARDPDAVTEIGPGRAMWWGFTRSPHANVEPVRVRVAPADVSGFLDAGT